MIWLEAIKESLEHKFITEIESTKRLFKERTLKQSRRWKSQAGETLGWDVFRQTVSFLLKLQRDLERKTRWRDEGREKSHIDPAPLSLGTA